MKTKRKVSCKATWRDVKKTLASMEKADLVSLIHELHDVSKENRMFLLTRLTISDDVLELYKEIIRKALNPEPHEEIFVKKARSALTQYRKAGGNPEGVAELGLFYCEVCIEFMRWCGIDYESYYSAIVESFAEALQAVVMLPAIKQTFFLPRIYRIQEHSEFWGYGAAMEIAEITIESGFFLDGMDD